MRRNSAKPRNNRETARSAAEPRVSEPSWINPWIVKPADLDPRSRRESRQTDPTGADVYQYARNARLSAQALRKTKQTRGCAERSRASHLVAPTGRLRGRGTRRDPAWSARYRGE